jgi:hypothetical protein
LLEFLSGPEDGGDMFLPNVGWYFNGLYGIISQNTERFITIAARTSNPAGTTTEMKAERWRQKQIIKKSVYMS